MILGAIAALNEPNGSNKTSISKYIESKYGNLPAGHTTLLSHHLNRMKDTGELVFWKNNYTKADPNAPPRRGRGRPPKPKVPLPPGAVLSPPRPRGRPPKDPNAPPKPVKPKVTTAGSGKPRGRPRKMARPAGGMPPAAAATTATVPMAAGTGRPRGRPPKVKPASVTEVFPEHNLGLIYHLLFILSAVVVVTQIELPPEKPLLVLLFRPSDSFNHLACGAQIYPESRLPTAVPPGSNQITTSDTLTSYPAFDANLV
ncbi:hypothetical protein Tsubulata_023394 [Turnera subulata]|uniref:H15 domain-containing protein n=1 Tax=Turnera subulata TaxID=218843 RepID=A0A9Q0F8A8_9ROSI|nr:hypothetical protein Tsubulata_023394 [Turnera subulata]